MCQPDKHVTIDFGHSSNTPEIRPWRRRAGSVEFPFAILPDRDHSLIHEPATTSGAQSAVSQQLGILILDALRCDSDDTYVTLAQRWHSVSEETHSLTTNQTKLNETFKGAPPDQEALHQYMQITVYVRDDEGQAVSDYFLEFFSPEQQGSDEAVYFHKNVLEHVHVNSQMPSRRCLFVDRTDLMAGYYPRLRSSKIRQVAVSISAAELGPNVRYFDSVKQGAKGHLIVHRENDELRQELGSARLLRNTTHLVEIIVPRQPVNKVFTLSQPT